MTIDAPTFARLATEHRAHLERLGRRLAGDAAEAEDLVQEALLRAYVHRDGFEHGTNARAWFCRILRNLFLDKRRRSAAYGRAEHHLRWEAESASVESPLEAVERRRRERTVRRALADLPEPFRSAVRTIDCEGDDYASAARALGCPEGTVMSRVFRGRRRLHEALAPLGLAPAAA